MGCGNSKPSSQQPSGGAGAAGGSGSANGSSTKVGERSVPARSDAKNGERIVMGKYKMLMGKEDNMGEGTSSICRKGTDIASGKEVAIKVYKEQKKAKEGSKGGDVTLLKFRRQIAVLEELQQPFKQPSDPSLWHERLNKVSPDQVFMVLLDYSKQADGQPGPDPTDDVLYVVTELAQYSLKDFISQRREQNKPLSKESIKNITKAIVTAMACLHAKGFVHLDMKPENMMMFNGRLKVIDVDGCVRTGTKVSISDSSISFSPCYCAPEWARFLIKESESHIVASPLLDCWSVGMTLCELISLDAVLKPMYASFLRNAQSHREAGFMFMEWLGGLKKPQLSKAVEKFDSSLLKVLTEGLLACKQGDRKNCAQCLSFDYIAGTQHEDVIAEAPRSSNDVKRVHRPRDRDEDDSSLAPLHKGVLWKLNSNGDAKDVNHWIRRDMWIAHNHSLCYYSQKDNKKLVLIDGQMLNVAFIDEFRGAARDFAFQVKANTDQDDKQHQMWGLAAENKEEYDEWMAKLKMTGDMDMIVTMKLGKQFEADLAAFRITVKNRRIKVAEDAKDEFEPVFKAKLWKVKGEGDRTKESDWFEREMWISKNGSLVYYSVKEETNLVYYTAQDLQRATVTEIPNESSFMPWALAIQLPPVDGVEFAPGEFAAESEEKRVEWMKEFSQLMPS